MTNPQQQTQKNNLPATQQGAQAPAAKPPSAEDTLKNFLSSKSMEEQLRQALPEGVSVERFRRILLTAISQNPDLVLANRPSLMVACFKCAADGLMPDGKEAALVPFWDKKLNQKAVTYMPMVAGIVKKMLANPAIKKVEAYVVHSNDKFEYKPGVHSRPVFEPDWFEERGERKGAFFVGVLDNGENVVEIMSKKQIMDVKAVSRGAESGPWNSNFDDEMWCKSVIRRGSKKMPSSPELAQVLKNDDDNYDFGDRQQIAAPATSSAPQLTGGSQGEPAPQGEPAAAPAAPVKRQSRAAKAMGVNNAGNAPTATTAASQGPTQTESTVSPASTTTTKPAAQPAAPAAPKKPYNHAPGASNPPPPKQQVRQPDPAPSYIPEVMNDEDIQSEFDNASNFEHDPGPQGFEEDPQQETDSDEGFESPI